MLGLAAEGRIVVDIKKVKPPSDVIAVRGDLFLGLVHVFTGLHGGRHAVLLPSRPSLDLKFVRLVGGICGHPLKDLSVTLTGLQLLKERFGLNSCKFDEMFIERAVVVILAVGPGDDCTPLVEHAGKDDITAEAGAGTTVWALREVHSVQVWILIMALDP